jgi:hypothetical protein
VPDWASPDLETHLATLLDHLRAAGGGRLRRTDGPALPLPYRRWSAETLKAATGPGRRAGDILPDLVDSPGPGGPDGHLGRRPAPGGRLAPLRQDGQGTGDAQPRCQFEVPPAGRSLDDVRSGLNQEWPHPGPNTHKAPSRRRRAPAAQGVHSPHEQTIRPLDRVTAPT